MNASVFGCLVAQLETHAVKGKAAPEMPKGMVEILSAMEELDRPVTPRELGKMLGRSYHNARWWIQLLRKDGFVYYTPPAKGKVSMTNPGGWRLTGKKISQV
jgi:hypothetical protein